VSAMVNLDSLVLSDAPICYGILMPGSDTPGGIPVVKVRDYDHSGIDVDSLLRTAPEVEAPYKRSRLEPGDILMSIRGTTGIIVLVPPDLSGANITQDTARIRVQQTDRDFLYQVLQAPIVQRQIRLHTIGQAVKGINIASVRQLRVPWPNQATRELVAHTLGNFDSIVRQITLLIDAKKALKRGIVQELFTGKRRFPEFANSVWTEVDLGEAFVERVETGRSDLPLLAVTGDRGIILRDELDKRDTSNPDKSKYKRVAIGDIAYNTMRMWQGVSALSALEGIVSPAYTVVVPTNRINPRFAKHLFKSPPVVHLFRRHSQGLVDDTLNLKFERFAKIKLTIPEDITEQARVAAVLDLCEHEIDLLEAQREQLELYKRGLLAKLLSGELQVPA
jgi:type I restriction enzyme, S subunit